MGEGESGDGKHYLEIWWFFSTSPPWVVLHQLSQLTAGRLVETTRLRCVDQRKSVGTDRAPCYGVVYTNGGRLNQLAWQSRWRDSYCHTTCIQNQHGGQIKTRMCYIFTSFEVAPIYDPVLQHPTSQNMLGSHCPHSRWFMGFLENEQILSVYNWSSIGEFDGWALDLAHGPKLEL